MEAPPAQPVRPAQIDRPIRARARVTLAAAGAGVLAVMCAATVCAVNTHADREATCEVNPARLAWWPGTAGVDAALRARGIAPALAGELAAVMSEAVAQETRMRAEVCGAEDLDAAARAQRTRCLDRRLLELGARWTAAESPETSPGAVPSILLPSTFDIPACATVRGHAAPPGIDAAQYAELSTLLDAWPTLATRGAQLVSLADRAELAGNPELAAVAWRRLAELERWRGYLARADDADARAQRLAQAAHAPELAGLVLADRAAVARDRQDLDGARAFVELAIAQSQVARARARFLVLAVAVSVAEARADHAATIAYGRQALGLVATEPPPLGVRKEHVDVERTIAFALDKRGQLAEAKTAIDRAVRHARDWKLDDGGDTLRDALRAAAAIHDDAGEPDVARAYRRAVLEVPGR